MLLPGGYARIVSTYGAENGDVRQRCSFGEYTLCIQHCAPAKVASEDWVKR